MARSRHRLAGPRGSSRRWPPAQAQAEAPASPAGPACGRVVGGHEHQATPEQRHIQVGHQDPQAHSLGRRPEGALDPHHPSRKNRETAKIRASRTRRRNLLPVPVPSGSQHAGQHQDPFRQGEVAGNRGGPRGGFPRSFRAVRSSSGTDRRAEAANSHQAIRSAPESPPGPVGQACTSQGPQEHVTPEARPAAGAPAEGPGGWRPPAARRPPAFPRGASPAGSVRASSVGLGSGAIERSRDCGEGSGPDKARLMLGF